MSHCGIMIPQLNNKEYNMSPTQECNIWNFKDETVTVKVITLTVWVSALKLELKGMKRSPSVSSIVRKHLSIPKSYPLADILLHLETSLADVKEQLGIAA